MVVAHIYICELIAIITKQNYDNKQNTAYQSLGFYTDMTEDVTFNQTGLKTLRESSIVYYLPDVNLSWYLMAF